MRPAGRGNALAYVVIVHGWPTGTFRRSIAGARVHIELTPFRKLSRAEESAVIAAAGRYARFLEKEPTVSGHHGPYSAIVGSDTMPKN